MYEGARNQRAQERHNWDMTQKWRESIKGPLAARFGGRVTQGRMPFNPDANQQGDSAPMTMYNPYAFRMDEVQPTDEQMATQEEYEMPYIPQQASGQRYKEMDSGDRQQLDNLQTVRRLLNDPKTTDSHRKWLESIVQTQRDSGAMRRMVDPKLLKQQQEWADKQSDALLKANSNPRTALTTAQNDAANAHIRTNAGMAFVAKPVALWERHMEDEDPVQALTKITAQAEKKFGRPEGSLNGLFGLTPEGGIDYKQNLVVYNALSKEKEISTGKRSIVKDALRGVQDQLKHIRETDNVLFDVDEKERAIPERSMWTHRSTELAREKDYTARRATYDNLVAQETKYLGMQRGWADPTDTGAETLDAPVVNQDTKTGITKDVSIFPRDKPFTAETPEEFRNQIPGIKAWIKSHPGQSVWVRNPENGDLVEIK